MFYNIPDDSIKLCRTSSQHCKCSQTESVWCMFQILGESGRVGGLRTCHPPYYPPLFSRQSLKFLSPYPPKIRSKITVTPPPPKKKGQSQNYGASINSKFTFQNHFEEILGRCNTRYHRIRLLVNKKWGPSPSTILQIYKQRVRPIFDYHSISTITT